MMMMSGGKRDRQVMHHTTAGRDRADLVFDNIEEGASQIC